MKLFFFTEGQVNYFTALVSNIQIKNLFIVHS